MIEQKQKMAAERQARRSSGSQASHNSASLPYHKVKLQRLRITLWSSKRLRNTLQLPGPLEDNKTPPERQKNKNEN
ncbi:MAG: hypothetical protein ACM31E_11105 [Fibrobacterota bacterium]